MRRSDSVFVQFGNSLIPCISTGFVDMCSSKLSRETKLKYQTHECRKGGIVGKAFSKDCITVFDGLIDECKFNSRENVKKLIHNYIWKPIQSEDFDEASLRTRIENFMKEYVQGTTKYTVGGHIRCILNELLREYKDPNMPHKLKTFVKSSEELHELMEALRGESRDTTAAPIS